MTTLDRLPFETFMGRHRPLGRLIDEIDETIWEKSSLSPVIKERARIATAEALSCSY